MVEERTGVGLWNADHDAQTRPPWGGGGSSSRRRPPACCRRLFASRRQKHWQLPQPPAAIPNSSAGSWIASICGADSEALLCAHTARANTTRAWARAHARRREPNLWRRSRAAQVLRCWLPSPSHPAGRCAHLEAPHHELVRVGARDALAGGRGSLFWQEEGVWVGAKGQRAMRIQRLQSGADSVHQRVRNAQPTPDGKLERCAARPRGNRWEEMAGEATQNGQTHTTRERPALRTHTLAVCFPKPLPAAPAARAPPA